MGDEHIKKIFQGEGMLASLGANHMFPAMVRLCSEFSLTPEALTDYWQVFCDMHDLDDGEPAPVAEVNKFTAYVKSKRAPIAKAAAKRGAAPLVNIKKESTQMSAADLSMFGIQGGQVQGGPAANRPVAAAGQVAAPVKREPAGVAPLASFSQSSKSDTVFMNRTGKRKVEASFPADQGEAKKLKSAVELPVGATVRPRPTSHLTSPPRLCHRGLG